MDTIPQTAEDRESQKFTEPTHSEDTGRIKHLEQEILDLKITNKAKDYFIEQLKGDRESLVQEQRGYSRFFWASIGRERLPAGSRWRGCRFGAREDLAKGEQTHICCIAHLITICDTIGMSRISIDISDEEHRKLKAMAALKGQSLKDFLLQRTLGETTETDDEAALVELVELLDARVKRADKEGVSTRTVDEIFRQARR